MRLPAMSSGADRITFSPSSGVIARQRGCRDFTYTFGGCNFNSRECCDIVVRCYRTPDGAEFCVTEKENCVTRGTGFNCTYDPGVF